ncbi:probable serine/threonine-protein kinase MARK-A [Chironomus tepperi]|uniref:probable serine/threonine-protein kinase MARK-A n=1 Tax=Chironomus tepperi TaxID=113505 RepID=UPI00391EE391
MLFKQYRIIFILIFMLLSDSTSRMIKANDIETTLQQHTMTNGMENVQSENKEGRSLFPRLEYTNEWTPVGRGDPLKDPTYDYMPPVLDRVRYWAEGSAHKNKNEVLLLGVSSKKVSSPNKKNNYGPIKRTYFSMPYQSQFSPPIHNQQPQHQQYNSQRIASHHRTPSSPDSYPMMSTHHYQHSQQLYQTAPPRKNPSSALGNNNMYQTEQRLENSIHQHRPTMTTTPTKFPQTFAFLPTIPPREISSSGSSNFQDSMLPSTISMSSNSSPLNFVPQNMSSKGTESTTVRPMTITLNEQTPFGSSTLIMNSHAMMSSSGSSTGSSSSIKTTKPLLHSILQTESAVPFSFTKKPSSAYQIEYTSNIYSPEAINSMATSSATTFVTQSTIPPTKPSVRPMSMKTTNKMIISTTERDEQKHYVQPDMHVGWPVYNLIIEGHSKVKTYGLKNDDPLALSMPKIRPIQPKDNPIVEHASNNNDEGPEYKLQPKQKAKKESTMESLLSILDGSFGNLLTSNNQEGENRNQHKGSRRKTRSTADVDNIDVNNKQERVVGVSFQVDERPQFYRKGTVISESMWPFENNADTSR